MDDKCRPQFCGTQIRKGKMDKDYFRLSLVSHFYVRNRVEVRFAFQKSRK